MSGTNDGDDGAEHGAGSDAEHDPTRDPEHETVDGAVQDPTDGTGAERTEETRPATTGDATATAAAPTTEAEGGATDLQLPSLSTGRRTVMGALAAGVGLGAVGSATAQDDDGEDGDDGGDGAQAGATMTAALSASEHGVFSEAHGAFHATHVDGGLEFVLHLEKIHCVTQAHIHAGDSCESGPVVVPLVMYTQTPAGDGEGAGENLQHADRDAPIVEVARVETGEDSQLGIPPEVVQDVAENPSNYYVNVHTTHHPGGEIRGQLRGAEVPETPETGIPGEGVPEGGMGGNETDGGMGGNETDGGMGGNETDGGDGAPTNETT